MLFVPIHSFDLEKHPEKWEELFDKTWPFYKRWFLKEGINARPGYLSSASAFEKWFPELAPTYHQLCETIGGGDLASRYLSMYCPPPYMSGCSQIAWARKDNPLLIRNYDYSPKYFEGVIMKTNWLKPIIGMSDCTWGLLDGVNSDGLCASLTFGGRRKTSLGFGIPVVLRYALETCSSTAEAISKLKEIPTHMSYNITFIDRDMNIATIYFVPGEANVVTNMAVGTNHQQEITWSDYAIMTRTIERKSILEQSLLDPEESTDSLIAKFHKPPLFNNDYAKAFGTLYTAIYSPINQGVTYLWPGNKELHQEMSNFKEGKLKIALKTDASRFLTV
ncbi:MAG: C45 family autoproteolytic acyltransferase/hydolase [Salibacteraceae bacterium]